MFHKSFWETKFLFHHLFSMLFMLSISLFTIFQIENKEFINEISNEYFFFELNIIIFFKENFIKNWIFFQFIIKIVSSFIIMAYFEYYIIIGGQWYYWITFSSPWNYIIITIICYSILILFFLFSNQNFTNTMSQ